MICSTSAMPAISITRVSTLTSSALARGMRPRRKPRRSRIRSKTERPEAMATRPAVSPKTMMPSVPTTIVQTRAKRYCAPAWEQVTSSPISTKPPTAVTMPSARLLTFGICSSAEARPSPRPARCERGCCPTLSGDSLCFGRRGDRCQLRAHPLVRGPHRRLRAQGTADPPRDQYRRTQGNNHAASHPRIIACASVSAPWSLP